MIFQRTNIAHTYSFYLLYIIWLHTSILPYFTSFARFSYMFCDISSKLIKTKFLNTVDFFSIFQIFLTPFLFPFSFHYIFFFFLLSSFFFLTLQFSFSWKPLHLSSFFFFLPLFFYFLFLSHLHFYLHLYFIFLVLIKNFPTKFLDAHYCVEFDQPAHVHIQSCECVSQSVSQSVSESVSLKVSHWACQ